MIRCEHEWELYDYGITTDGLNIPFTYWKCLTCPTRRLECDQRDYVITDDSIEPYEVAS